MYQYLEFILHSFIYYIEKLKLSAFSTVFYFIFYRIIFYVKPKNKNILLLLWTVAPYLLFRFIIGKYPTYTIPILSAIVIFSVFWIYKIKNRRLQKYVTLSIIVFEFVQFFIVSYSTILTDLALPEVKIKSYRNSPSKLDW